MARPIYRDAIMLLVHPSVRIGRPDLLLGLVGREREIQWPRHRPPTFLLGGGSAGVLLTAILFYLFGPHRSS